MKVNLIKDENGNVVATYENAPAGGPMIRPVLKQGHSVHEVEAQSGYANDIKALYRQHSRR
jgi:hypothetical protein